MADDKTDIAGSVGASDGLSSCGSSQQAVSPVPASIPDAKWVGFNVNLMCRAKLTEAGVAQLRKNHDQINSCYKNDPLGEFKPPAVDAEGYTRFQLWSLMAELGPAISMGAQPPFCPEILLPAQAIEARQGGDAEQAPSQDESAVEDAPETQRGEG